MRFPWPWRKKRSFVQNKSADLAVHVRRQLEAGSVDEGNASMFDPLVDSWVATAIAEECLPLEEKKSAFVAKLSEGADRLEQIETRLGVLRADTMAQEPALRIEVLA